VTERDFEQRLRDEFRQMVNEAAPPALRASVIAIPDLVPPTPERRWTAGWRLPSLNRFAPFALAATAIVVTVLIGIGLVFRLLPTVGPSPVPVPTHEATPGPTATPAPTAGPLGGGLILTGEAIDQVTPSRFDVFTLDAGTGQKTLLGTLPWGPGDQLPYDFQLGADRRHVLITRNGEGPLPLGNQTGAGRELSIVCCELPPDVLQIPPKLRTPGKTQYSVSGGYAWVLSPQSDRIAGLHDGPIHVQGCDLCTAPDGVVILDVDGSDLRSLPLPAGTQGSGPISWSPDGSAVVITACRPCNNAYPPDKPPTAIQHTHFLIVPVDGSPIRELLDEPETIFGSLGWSPDGATIAFGRNQCPPKEHAPSCQAGNLQLVTMSVADGHETVVADVTGDRLEWSPDGRRIAIGGIFVMDADGSHLAKLSDGEDPEWSPDGSWLLFSTYDLALKTNRSWIVPADGGEPRLLGPYGGYAW